jgi:hypothetical protein
MHLGKPYHQKLSGSWGISSLTVIVLRLKRSMSPLHFDRVIRRSLKLIYLVFLTCLVAGQGCHTPLGDGEDDFKSLFDGESLKGWTLVNPKGGGFGVTNLVENGASVPVIYCAKGGGGYLLSEEEYDDFIMRFRFKLTYGANNGLAIRAPMQAGKLAYEGMELQILDNANAEERYQKELRPEQFHGALYDIAPPKALNALKPLGQWNEQEVRVVGRQITVKLNGLEILDANLNDIKNPVTLLKHPGLLRSSGHVGFLGHNDEVYFSDIRIRPIARVQLNNKEPEGFQKLFNGEDLAGWRGLLAKPNDNPVKRSKLDPKIRVDEEAKADQLMLTHWQVADGELVFDGKGASLTTAREDYANYELWADWKTASKGDSGIYLRGNPQVQIWDPRGTDHPKASVGSGALFNNKNALSEPLVKADRIAGDWNRFKILMIEDRVHVYLNGKLVVNNTPMENYWEKGKPLPSKGSIELQAHGSKMWFRNIYIREIK